MPGDNEGIYTIPVHARRRDRSSRTKLNEILGHHGAAPAPPAAATRRPAAAAAAALPARRRVAGGSGSDDDVAGAMPSKILVDERTNTLIVVSSEAGYLRVKALVERLDISLDTEGGAAIHVYPLENALAEELATTLNNAMRKARSARQPARRRARRAGRHRRAAGAAAAAGGGGELGAALEGQVRVIGDKPTNSLIVMSSGRDYLAIKDVIQRLDQPRRQVFIEALILEVQLDKELDLGTSSHGGLPVDNGGALVLGGVQTPNLSSLNVAVARVARPA